MKKKDILKRLTIAGVVLSSLIWVSQAHAHAEELPTTKENALATETTSTSGDKISDVTVTQRVVEKASTEYREDSTKDKGHLTVVKEAKHGVETTTTTYKEEESGESATPISQTNKDILSKTEGTLTPVKNWTKDSRKALPSDQIVIDEKKLFDAIPSEDKELTNQNIINLLQYGKATASGKTYTSNLINPESSEIKELFSKYAMMMDFSMKGSVLKDTSDPNQYLFFASLDNLVNAATGYYTGAMVDDRNNVWTTQQNAVERYHIFHQMTDEMYASLKADYLRAMLAAKNIQTSASQEITEEVNQRLELANKAFNVITQRYNNLHQRDFTLPVVNQSEKLSKENLTNLEENIKKLPYEVRKNLLSLTLQDTTLEKANKTNTPVAITKFNAGEIIMQYSKIGNPDSLLRIFLHELSHAIDLKGGFKQSSYMGGYLPTFARGSVVSADNNNTKIPLLSQFGFSQSQEFKEIYDRYFNRKEVRDYYRNNIEEAFAEGFGQFMRHKFFGKPYVRFAIVDSLKEKDKALALRDESTVRENEKLPEAEYKEIVAKYYPTAYSPLEEAEVFAYYDKLYNQLFGESTVTKVVDKVTTTTTKAENGLILVGTKAKETTREIPFETVEEVDASLPVGSRVLKRAGQTGIERTLVSYALKSSTSSELVETVTKEVLKEARNAIYLLGSKQVNPTTPEEPQHPTKPVEPTNPTVPEGPSKPEVSTEIQVQKPGATQAQVTSVASFTYGPSNYGYGSEHVLPKTGETDVHWMQLMGALTLGTAGLVLRKRTYQENN